MDEMDKILAELKAENEKKQLSPGSKSPQTPPNFKEKPFSPLDNLLGEIKAEFEQPRKQTPPQTNFSPITKPVIPLENNLLKEIQQELAAAEKEKAQKQEQELKEKQEQEAIAKRQAKEAIAKQAEQWLKNLNPHSDEGLWFEEFAYSYQSRLEAAIDYLQAIN